MSEIEVTIFNQKLKLSYQDNEKQRLIYAVETLNDRWSKYSHLYGKVSDLKIITLISLELQDSVEAMQSLKDKEVELFNKIELLQKEITAKNFQLEESVEKIKKYEIEVSENNQEISKAEIILDELNTEILKIKHNILKNLNE